MTTDTPTRRLLPILIALAVLAAAGIACNRGRRDSGPNAATQPPPPIPTDIQAQATAADPGAAQPTALPPAPTTAPAQPTTAPAQPTAAPAQPTPTPEASPTPDALGDQIDALLDQLNEDNQNADTLEDAPELNP